MFVQQDQHYCSFWEVVVGVESLSLQVSWHSLPIDPCTAHTHTYWYCLCAWTILHFNVSFPQSRQSGGIWANPKAKWTSWRKQVNLESVAGPSRKSDCPSCCWWSAVPWLDWLSSTRQLWKVRTLAGLLWNDNALKTSVSFLCVYNCTDSSKHFLTPSSFGWEFQWIVFEGFKAKFAAFYED